MARLETLPAPSILLFLMDGNPRELFEKEIKECAGHKYAQSSKVSSLCRFIIYAILALVWPLSYVSNKGFNFTNIFLIIALLGSLAYLLLDIIHYFTDSVAYHSLAMTLQKGDGDEQCLRWYYEVQSEKIGCRSSRFLTCKFIFMLVISVFFITGMCVCLWG